MFVRIMLLDWVLLKRLGSSNFYVSAFYSFISLSLTFIYVMEVVLGGV